ncbi:chemotaxis response regulator protein-glutamate methylesterase [Hahella sp. SMD15-11]|uniref:Protein-glutamate methylesterase/protein-glutamine glutaminase n=1 Tax=Thermohahella caldifontis TaxID=3142973 RepID=A0AB39UST4_9GAMM
MTKTVRVLIVDDSPLMRALLREIINGAPDLEVVGEAGDPYEAREAIKALNPDVITLDVEMPRMDGLTFLRNLMRLRPMPVIMVSSLTRQGSQITLDALEIGALDYVGKPQGDLCQGLETLADEIREKLRMAAAVSPEVLLIRQKRLQALSGRSTPMLAAQAGARTGALPAHTRKLVAMGASTGGLDALTTVLSGLGTEVPGIVIVQHIPAGFSASFAARINRLLPLEVVEAEPGMAVRPGRVVIAEGDHHLRVRWNGKGYVCELEKGPRVSRHRPSVDVLFDSVAEHAGPEAIGVLLTGMGEDGARGLLNMKTAGAWTIAQDEASSVVWGMPGRAVKIGAAREVLPLEQIAGAILARSHTR